MPICVQISCSDICRPFVQERIQCLRHRHGQSPLEMDEKTTVFTELPPFHQSRNLYVIGFEGYNCYYVEEHEDKNMKFDNFLKQNHEKATDGWR